MKKIFANKPGTEYDRPYECRVGTPDNGGNAPTAGMDLEHLKAELEEREAILRESESLLEERERFVEESEALLHEKTQELMEAEARLEQMKEELAGKVESWPFAVGRLAI